MLYCDYNATTPLRPEVLDAMLPFLREQFGNPSSVHRLGAQARVAVEEVRSEVAGLVGARPSEVVFTSGGTEANALAILGSARELPSGSVLSVAIEHSSVRAPLAELGTAGWRTRLLDLDADGRLTRDALAREAAGDVRLVSVAWANNEIGTVQPIAEISAWCRGHGIRLHSDAVQAAGKLAVDASLVDLLSLSAHKLGGPKGIGALVVRSGVVVAPLFRGGGQERERRGGTENVAGIVGFAAACRAARRELASFAARTAAWREELWQRLADRVPDVRRNSPTGDACLPNTLNISFDEVAGEALVAALDLDGIAVSSGAACAAGAGEPSHVLLALGRDDDGARSGVRFSFGWDSGTDEVARLASAVASAVGRIRAAAGRRKVA